MKEPGTLLVDFGAAAAEVEVDDISYRFADHNGNFLAEASSEGIKAYGNGSFSIDSTLIPPTARTIHWLWGVVAANEAIDPALIPDGDKSTRDYRMDLEKDTIFVYLVADETETIFEINRTDFDPAIHVETVITPLAPTGLTATADSDTEITLEWVAPDNTGRPEITGYRIQRRSPAGAGDYTTIVADTESTDVEYQDTGLVADTEYEYQVAAINSAGVGAYSDAADETTDA